MLLRFLLSARRAIAKQTALAASFSLALIAVAAAGQDAPAAHKEVLIKNAVVMTATHGSIDKGSVYIKDGKIAGVGRDVNAPRAQR